MCGNAVLGEEHMFGAAQTDAFGSEQAGCFGIARDVGVGAHAEVAAELVGPFHEGGEVVRFRIGLAGLALAEIDFAERAIERNPFTFFDDELLAFESEWPASCSRRRRRRPRRRRTDGPCRARPRRRGW